MLDLGAGDGRFVLATAAACPDSLVIGVDADAAALVEASRRAARKTERGGLSNVLFVVAAAASLPHELDGAVAALTVHFPWGSLLRGLLCADPSLLAGIARVARPGASLTLLLSVAERDHVAGVVSLDAAMIERLGRAYAARGFILLDARPAMAADIATAHSSWARRLGVGARRPAWLLCFAICAPGGVPR